MRVSFSAQKSVRTERVESRDVLNFHVSSKKPFSRVGTKSVSGKSIGLILEQ